MDFKLYFGDIELSVYADFFHGRITEKMRLFMKPEEGVSVQKRVSYHFEIKEFTVPEDAVPIWKDEDMRVYRTAKCDYRVFCCFGETEDYAVVLDDRSGKVRGYILPGKERYFPSTFHFQPLLMLDSVFVRNGAMVLHAANIIWNGKSILFSGASGVGKSTQASLWKRYGNARIINGDRALLGEAGGEFRAFGISWCGSSEICENKSAPVRAVVMLRQGSENRLGILQGIEACKMILKECAAAPWNAYDKNLLLEQVIRLVKQVPVYLFSCTPDRNAVEYLEKHL